MMPYVCEVKELVLAFEIVLTLIPCYVEEAQMSISSTVIGICYDGWINVTCMFVLSSGRPPAMLEVKFTIVDELNRIIYNVSNTMTTLSREGCWMHSHILVTNMVIYMFAIIKGLQVYFSVLTSTEGLL